MNQILVSLYRHYYVAKLLYPGHLIVVIFITSLDRYFDDELFYVLGMLKRLTFSPPSGAVATSDIDYVNENRTVTVSVFDQDTIEVCQPVLVNSDSLIERTEYFTVALYVPIVRVSGTCQVAIIDKNGGKYEYNFIILFFIHFIFVCDL